MNRATPFDAALAASPAPGIDEQLSGGWNGSDLAQLLSLQALGADRFRVLHNESNAGGEVFGGQYLGQALSAALATGGGRAPHAMHAFFLRAARADRPLEAQVERLREGRSFAHRRVSLVQDGEAVFCADVSLHDEEPGQPDHQMTAPQMPPPESLRNLPELFEAYGEAAMGWQAASRMLRKKTAELRPIDQRAGLVERGAGPRADVWLRATQFQPSDPLLHYAALAYLSDHWVNFASRVMHGRTLFDGETTSASLNHSLWFHRRPRVSGWLLYLLDSPSTHGGTGFNRGLIYEPGGDLIASAAQEALVRRPREAGL